MKLPRVIPWTSHAASSGFAISLTVILFPLVDGYGSGQERLDRRQDRGHFSRSGEGAIRCDRLVDERGEGCRMARLNCVNRQRRGQHFGVLNVGGLSEIGCGAEVLDV